MINQFVSRKKTARSELQKLYNAHKCGNSFTFAEQEAVPEVPTDQTSKNLKQRLSVRLGEVKQEFSVDSIDFVESIPMSSAYITIKHNFRVILFLLHFISLIIVDYYLERR